MESSLALISCCSQDLALFMYLVVGSDWCIAVAKKLTVIFELSFVPFHIIFCLRLKIVLHYSADVLIALSSTFI